jgi:hypothetical protein
MMLPKCIKDPIKEFFLDQILKRMPFFQKLQQIEGIWNRLEDAAITILKQVFVDGNLRGAIWTFFSTMLDLLGLPPQLVMRVIAKGAQNLNDILNDPLGFLGNFLSALKLGFQQFFGKIGTYLLSGLQAWLLGQLEGTGIEIPKDVSFKSMLKLAFQILGITVDMLVRILEEVSGKKGLKAKIDRAIGAISKAWEWFEKLVSQGKEGESFWDRLSNAVGSIWDMILDGVAAWLEKTIVVRALAWVAEKLDPTGIMAVITTVIDVFNIIQSIMAKAREIFEIIERVLDGIGDLIKGILAAAATAVEKALGAAIPVAMALLSALVGLDGVVDQVKETIEDLREKVEDGIRQVMTSIKEWLLQFFGGSDGKDTIAAALEEIKSEGEAESDDGEISKSEADAIKDKVNLDHPEVIEIGPVQDGGETWDFEYVQRKKAQVAKRKVPKVYIEPSKHPESAQHAEEAMNAGKPSIVTLDRGPSASQRRARSVYAYKSKHDCEKDGTGYRKPPCALQGEEYDEYPLAMFEENAGTAHVKPINGSDNGGSGSSMMHQCKPFADKNQVKVVVDDKP